MTRFGWILIFLAATLMQGCILLTGDVYEPVPDPLSDHFISGTAVKGRAITLSNGQIVQLAGIDTQQLTEEQITAFEGGLSKLVVGQKQLLVLDKHDDIAFIATQGRHNYPWESFPAIILFPVHKKVPPERIDIGLQLVQYGLVKIKESELLDTVRLDAYRQSQELAKRCHIGVWKTNSEFLCDAAAKGDLKKVQALVKSGTDVNGVGYTLQDATTPLISASAKGQEEVVRFLLKQDVNVKAYVGSPRYGTGTALTAAAANGHAQIVSLLIAAGAVVNQDDWSSPLEYAVSNEHAEVVKILLEAGAKVTDEHDESIIVASSKGKIEIVKLLLEHGADVNATNRGGDTPLIMAAWQGHADVVKYLIDKGANVNARDKSSYTALKLARQNNHNAVVAILEKAGGKE